MLVRGDLEKNGPDNFILWLLQFNLSDAALIN